MDYSFTLQKLTLLNNLYWCRLGIGYRCRFLSRHLLVGTFAPILQVLVLKLAPILLRKKKAMPLTLCRPPPCPCPTTAAATTTTPPGLHADRPSPLLPPPHPASTPAATSPAHAFSTTAITGFGGGRDVDGYYRPISNVNISKLQENYLCFHAYFL